MTPQHAKKIVRDWLTTKGLPYAKLTAHTVDFTDLARDQAIFVKVKGWQPNSLWNDLKSVAKANGFFVEA